MRPGLKPTLNTCGMETLALQYVKGMLEGEEGKGRITLLMYRCLFCDLCVKPAEDFVSPFETLDEVKIPAAFFLDGTDPRDCQVVAYPDEEVQNSRFCSSCRAGASAKSLLPRIV